MSNVHGPYFLYFSPFNFFDIYSKSRSTDLVDIVISSNPILGYTEASSNFKGNDFRSLDFNQAKFDEIKDSLKNKDWLSL